METLVDNKPAHIPDFRIRRGIFVVGTFCGLIYVAFFLVMASLGFMHITELRAFNFIVLFIASFLMIRKWVHDTHHFIPFLKVIGTVFFTGLWSFIVLSIFLTIYTWYNPELYDLFIRKTMGLIHSWPQFVVLFEGAAVSIVIAFILMQYFRRYEEGGPFRVKDKGAPAAPHVTSVSSGTDID